MNSSDNRLNPRFIAIATACLLLCSITGCFTGLTSDIGALAAPNLVSSLFYTDNNRWPTSRVELVEYASKHPDLAFTNSLYSTLILDVQTNNSLIIHCELAAPLTGKTEMHLDQPKVTKY